MASLHGVFKAILNGTVERGEGGILYVNDKDECKYAFPHEFHNPTFRSSLETLMEEDDGVHFYVAREADGKVHLVAYPKERVRREAMEACGVTEDAA